jgi:N6-adenosine-specific RNA methylase IME4
VTNELTVRLAADLESWGDRKLDNAIKRGHVTAGKHSSGYEKAAAVTGYMLQERKRRLKHGEWMPWVEKHFDGDHRTATEYMRKADEMVAQIGDASPISSPVLDPVLTTPDPPVGTYRTIVIDPPWPMQKIERDVRLNQTAPLDYYPMSIEELREFRVPAADDGCHLYLWTTHKFLPAALELADAWGFRYQCLLTWVKNVGFTPFSFMYSTELVIFARRGSLDLLVKGRRLDFAAKVREHSRKPDEFYDLVRDVSPGPRIDMFSREPRDGFDQWGNETERFDNAA